MVWLLNFVISSLEPRCRTSKLVLTTTDTTDTTDTTAAAAAEQTINYQQQQQQQLTIEQLQELNDTWIKKNGEIHAASLEFTFNEVEKRVSYMHKQPGPKPMEVMTFPTLLNLVFSPTRSKDMKDILQWGHPTSPLAPESRRDLDILWSTIADTSDHHARNRNYQSDEVHIACLVARLLQDCRPSTRDREKYFNQRTELTGENLTTMIQNFVSRVRKAMSWNETEHEERKARDTPMLVLEDEASNNDSTLSSKISKSPEPDYRSIRERKEHSRLRAVLREASVIKLRINQKMVSTLQNRKLQELNHDNYITKKEFFNFYRNVWNTKGFAPQK